MGLLPELPGLEGMFEGVGEGARMAREHFDLQMERISTNLHSIRQAVESLDEHKETVIVREHTIADGTGLAIVNFDAPRPGYDYSIERATIVTNGGVTAIGVLYLSEIAPSNAVHQFDNANFFAAEFGQPIYVPQGIPSILLRVSGAPANADVQARLQMIQRRVNF